MGSSACVLGIWWTGNYGLHAGVKEIAYTGLICLDRIGLGCAAHKNHGMGNRDGHGTGSASPTTMPSRHMMHMHLTHMALAS